MKNKQLYTSFICYFVLIAFISIIGLQFSSYSIFGHSNTEVSSKRNNTNNDALLLFEEDEEDYSNHHVAFFTICFWSIFYFLFLKKEYSFFISKLFELNLYQKTPLFIMIRILRI